MAIQAIGPQAKVDELTVQLIATNKRGALEVAGAAISALGVIGLAWTLSFLFAASRGAFHAPTNFFEYDMVGNSFTGVVPVLRTESRIANI